MKWLKKNFVMLLIIAQPILDVIAFFSMNTKYSWFSFIVRSLFLLFIICYTLMKKNNKWYKIYLSIICCFGLCHFINSYFTTNISLIGDIKEFVRVFYMPLITVSIYTYIKNDTENKKNYISQIKKGIVINTLQIFLVIILSLITGNVVYTYSEGIGLRGWFYNSNSQSVILCFCVPFSILYIFKYDKIFLNIIWFIISFFLLYSNGTTGCYLLIILSFGLIIYDVIFNKFSNKKKIIYFIILLIPIFSSVIFYKYSPDYKITKLASNSLQISKEENANIKNNNDLGTESNKEGENTSNSNDTNNSNKIEKIEDDSSNLKQDNLTKSYEQKLVDHYFKSEFVEKYGYEIIINSIGKDLKIEKLVNNRYRKKLVAKVIFNNSSFSSKLFGVEFDIINLYGIDLESDYSAILYYYGYIGFLVYILLPVYCFILLMRKITINVKSICDSEFVLDFAMFIMLNLFAEFSGSLLKRPNASIYVSFLLILIMIKYTEKRNNYE